MTKNSKKQVVISLTCIRKMVESVSSFEQMNERIDKFVRFMCMCLHIEYYKLDSDHYRLTFFSSSLLPFTVTSDVVEHLFAQQYIFKLSYYGQS